MSFHCGAWSYLVVFLTSKENGSGSPTTYVSPLYDMHFTKDSLASVSFYFLFFKMMIALEL